MPEPLQRVLAWAKANPVLAGGLVIGAAVLGYIISKAAKGTEATVAETAEEAGIGGGESGLGDDVIPIQPIPEVLLPEPGYLGSGQPSNNQPSQPVSFGSSIAPHKQFSRAEFAAYSIAQGWTPSTPQPQHSGMTTGPLRGLQMQEALQTLTGTTGKAPAGLGSTVKGFSGLKTNAAPAGLGSTFKSISGIPR